ncbi:hypothetical protein CEP81_11870 [Kocuria rhizophila]|nr:hypothetical protein CEP81_11870 [Kocuria rhizophila]
MPGAPHPARATASTAATMAVLRAGEVRGEVRESSILAAPAGRRLTQGPRIRWMRGPDGVRPIGFEPTTF